MAIIRASVQHSPHSRQCSTLRSLGNVQVLHQQVRGWGGVSVQDQNDDVIIEQILTEFMHHNETFFNNMSLKFGEGSYQNLYF